MKKFRWLSLLLVSVMVLYLAACSNTPAQTKTPAPSASAAANTGGILKIVNGGVLKNVMGFSIAGGWVESFCSSPAIETLARYNEKGEVIGWLAKEIKVDAAGLKVVLTLQQGVKYHDGTDFNAQAVCDVWQIYKDNGYSSKFTNVKSFSATGPNEVTVNLTAWSSDTVTRLCLDAGRMISPTLFKQIGMEAMYTKIVGTGPFTLKSVNAAEGLEYVKNPNYWIKGQPYLDGIKIITTKDMITAQNILKSGDADIMLNVADAKIYTELISAGFKRYGVDTCISPTLYGIYFASGNKNDAMSNLLIRQAFCYAIDTKAMIKALTYGTGAYTNQLAVQGTKEYNDQVVGYPYNADKAKALIKQAGYSDTNKPTVTLTYQLQFRDAFVAVQGYLQSAGFNVKLDEVDATVYGDRIVVGKPAPYTSTAQWIAPTTCDSWTRYFTAAPTTMVVNSIDLNQAGIIDTYSKVMLSTDTAQQKAALMQLQKQCIDDNCLFFPLYITPNFFAGNAKVKDSGIGMTATSSWTPETTKLSK